MAPVIDHIVHGDRFGAAVLHTDLQMILQIDADARYIGDHRDSKVAQDLGRTESGQLQELRRIECAAGDDDFAIGISGAHFAMLDVLDANGAAAQEQDAARERVGDDCEIVPAPRLPQIADRRRPAPAVFRRQLEIAGALLRRAVEIIVARNAGLLRGLDEGFAERMRLADIGNRKWSADTVEVVAAATLIFGAPEIGQHVGKAPAGIAELPPMIVILVLAADIEQTVDRTRSAQHLAARLDDLAVIELRLWLGFAQPIDFGIVEQLAIAERDMNPDMPVMAAGFKQQDAVQAGFGQPIGQDAAGGAGADDDVIEPCLIRNRRHPCSPYSSILIAGFGEYNASPPPHSEAQRGGDFEETRVNKFGVGQPVLRVEDPRFITGRGRFVDDFELPQQCYGVVVMSPHAHARIKRIDTAKAKAAPGVLALLTGADAAADKLGGLAPPMPEDMGGPKGFRTLRAILEREKVRAVGDRVAFVVAETAAQARDAAELIEIDYEPLPAVVGVEDAVKSGAPAVWDEAPNNVAFTLMMGNKDATDAAFAKARHVVSLKLNDNRITANSIEPRAAIGQYHPDSDSYTLYSTSQNPHGTRSAVAGQVLKIPETKLRVISPDVGGGFGMKTGSYPEDALVVWASRRVGGRPVKWVSTRSEALLGDTQGRDQIVTGELALDEHGKILGLRVNALHAMGSHVFGASFVVPLFALRLAPGVYQIPAVHAVGRAVFTNTPPMHPYRGAGRPEATFLIEMLLDRAARAVGVDAVEIRRRNFIPSAAMPHKVQTGITYDSGDFVHVMDECLKLADWNGFGKRAAESKKRGKLRGRGVGYFLEEAAVFNDRMVLRFDPSGMLTILAGTHSHGQGHQTVYMQMVSEWLGVPFETIRFVQGDTDAVPMGRGTYGSRRMP